MSKIAIFMVNGCEEIEGLTVVDNCRRVGIEIDMVSITDSKTVAGAHGISFEADKTIADMNLSDYDGVVLPGGMPGTLNLGACDDVVLAIKQCAAEGKLVAAICAAPSVLGDNHILEGKKATCYPGFEERLIGATCTTDAVAVDGNVITSRGMGTAIEFSLAIIEYFMDKAAADKLANGIIYR